MNLKGSSTLQTRNSKRENGSATILVFALLAIMVLYMNSNQIVLHTLKRDLRLVEQKQLKKFQLPPKPAQP